MKEVRAIISENLTQLRKEKKLTQLELAEKFNYSDKAVSKWENGDTLPDIETLQQLCEFYGVTLDYLTHEGTREEKAEYITDQTEKNNKIAICALIICAVWVLATVVFVYYQIATKETIWPIFVLGFPVSCLAFLVCNRIFFRSRRILFINLTCFVWGILATIYLFSSFYDSSRYASLWPLFLIAVPLQASLIIWLQMKTKK